MKARLVSVIAAAALALAGCGQLGNGGPGTTGPGTGTQGSTETDPAITPSGTQTTGTATQPPPAAEPTSTVTNFKITYNWGVPSSTVSIKNPLNVPIGGANDPPLPWLVAIYVGDHPEESPQYQRISFYFRGAFPSYNLAYVAAVVTEAVGNPIALQGNAFLRIGFTNAQAHSPSGASTVKAAPKNPIGFKTLKSYGFAGDFEGYVSYGLGLQVAPGSDQQLKIRAGQLKKSDGSGGSFYVVFVDVQKS